MTKAEIQPRIIRLLLDYMRYVTTRRSSVFLFPSSSLSVGKLFLARRVFSHVLVINIKVLQRANGVRIADSNTAAASLEEGTEREVVMHERGVDRALVYYLAGFQSAARLASVLSF